MQRGREESRPYDPECPFCPGNEALTTEELFRLPGGGAGEGPGWRVRVVCNKYPVLLEEMPADVGESGGCGQVEPAVGRHEVIVETPIHDADLAGSSSDEVLEVLQACRERFAAAAADPRIEHVVIFRNQGRLAHASLTHPHSQLAGLPFVPPFVAHVLERSRAHAAAGASVLLLELVEAEVEDGARLLEVTERLATFVPFAAAHDHEIWIVPRQLPPRFDRVDDLGLRGLGDALRRATQALAVALGHPDYNSILHMAPLRDAAEQVLPWYLQIIPRRAVRAGFEMGIGVRILTTAPESAAQRLQSALREVAGF
jgi:UDPglucose--hexose-1-phosphate uridylyltransferase